MTSNTHDRSVQRCRKQAGQKQPDGIEAGIVVHMEDLSESLEGFGSTSTTNTTSNNDQTNEEDDYNEYYQKQAIAEANRNPAYINDGCNGKDGSKHNQIKEKQSQKDEGIVRRHTVYKYGTSIPLAEEILLGTKNVFLQIINGEPVISSNIDLSQKGNFVLYPHQDGLVSPILPFTFKDMEEIRYFIKQAKQETIDSLYFKSKSLWKKFVVAEEDQIILLAADSIFTFFQDLFATTHYTMIVGAPGSGKGATLVTFKYLGYRVVLASDMSGANLLDLLGSIETGQITIAEDELDDIDEDADKRRIYKVGYDIHGVATRTLDGNKSSRTAKLFFPFGYKIFAAEESFDSAKMDGFNDRTFTTKSVKGKPLFYIKELAKPKNSKRYLDIKSRVDYFRKLMIIYRLLHVNDPIKYVQTNIDGRPLELTGPQICLFSSETLSEDKSALREILPVLSGFLRQKGEMSNRTLEGVIYTVLVNLTSDGSASAAPLTQPKTLDSSHNNYIVENDELCEAVRCALGGVPIQGQQAFYTTEFDKVTHKKILKSCRDKFKAEPTHVGTGSNKSRGLRFDKHTLLQVGKTFEVVSEIQIISEKEGQEEESDEDKSIWKDWNSLHTGDKNNDCNKTTGVEDIPSSAICSDNNQKASDTALTAISDTTCNNNLGTMGRSLSHFDNIQSPYTEPQSMAIVEHDATYIEYTASLDENPDKIVKSRLGNVNISNNGTVSTPSQVDTKTIIQPENIYPHNRANIVPLSQIKVTLYQRQNHLLSTMASQPRQAASMSPEYDFECYYCNNGKSYQTNDEVEYRRHVVNKHPDKSAYPSRADIQSLGIQAQGKSWEI